MSWKGLSGSYVNIESEITEAGAEKSLQVVVKFHVSNHEKLN